jgi:hypothetical protein
VARCSRSHQAVKEEEIIGSELPMVCRLGIVPMPKSVSCLREYKRNESLRENCNYQIMN